MIHTPPPWSTACPDWEQRIINRQSLVPFDPLFPEEADYALEVFKALRIGDLPGKPTFGEVCAPWVFDFVRAIFGATTPEGGAQLINQFLLCIAKKNTKSTIAAGIMMTALIIGWRPDEELLILAPTIEVAGNSFTPAASMVRADPELTALFHVQDNTRTITHRTLRSKLKVIAADNDTVSGKKSGRILIDELWLFGTKPKAAAMLQEATGGLVSRPEGFVIYLTTQSDYAPAGVFKDKLDYGRNVRDGKIVDNTFLPIIYEYPDEVLKNEGYLDPEQFYMTNPNIGLSVSKEWIERTLNQTTETKARVTFLAKHLNVEIKGSISADSWPGAEFWARTGKPEITYESMLSECSIICVGIDGGGLDDLFGLSLVGRHRDTDNWWCWSHAWAHTSVLERRKTIASRLRDFEAEGSLTIVDDRLEDLSSIIEIIGEIKSLDLLAMVSVDPAGIGELVEALSEIGVTQDNKNLVASPQGFQLMNALKTTERKLARGLMFHDDSAMMQWCVDNVRIEPTATAIRATKMHAGEKKIDPIMAAFNAVTVMTRLPEPARKPTYEMMVIG